MEQSEQAKIEAEIVAKYEKQMKELNTFMEATIDSLVKEKDKNEKAMKQEIRKLTKMVQQFESKVNPLSAVAIKEQTELQEQYNDLNELVTLLKDEATKNTTEIEKLKAKNEELSNTNEELSNTLKSETQKKESVETISQELMKKTKELEGVIESKDKDIQQLHLKLKELQEKNEEILKSNKEIEEKNNGLLEYIQKINKQTAELQKKRQQEEELIKTKKAEEEQVNQNKQGMLSQKEYIIINEVISDYLAKIKVSEYSLSLFDIIEQICLNLDKIDEICQSNNHINNVLINTYNDIKFYYFLHSNETNQNVLYNNFLARYTSTINKNSDQSIIEVVSKVKVLTAKDNTILEQYRTKREKLNASASMSFGVITNYIAKKYSKEKLITKDIIELFNKTTPNSDLIIDFPSYFKVLQAEHINVYGDTHNFFYAYYAQTILPKEKKITIILSPMNNEIDITTLFYFFSLYCYNLNSLSFIYQSHKNDSIEENLFRWIVNGLPFSLKSLPLLNELVLDGIRIPRDNITSFAKSLEQTKIASLTLANSLSQEVLPYLSNYLLNNNLLIKLILAQNPCNVPTFFLSSLQTIPKLAYLNLSKCELNEEDINSISTLIQQNTNIIFLDISNNNISLKGCSLLCLALKKNKTLIKINLSDCGLTDESILMLFEKTGQNLQSIVLNNNKLGNTGIIGLTNFLITNKVLSFLSVQNCEIGIEGIKTFLSTIVISKSPKLVVHFEKNPMIEDNNFANCLNMNKAFFKGKKEFYFSESRLSKELLPQLKEIEFVKIVE